VFETQTGRFREGEKREESGIRRPEKRRKDHNNTEEGGRRVMLEG